MGGSLLIQAAILYLVCHHLASHFINPLLLSDMDLERKCYTPTHDIDTDHTVVNTNIIETTHSITATTKDWNAMPRSSYWCWGETR